MTDQADEIAAIAGELTAAQREAVLNLPADGGYADEYTDPPWPNLHMRVELGALGEMRPNTRFRHAFRLTARGIAVRNHLESNHEF